MGLISIVITFLILLSLRILYEFIRDRSLPPGPSRLPFIGNLHQAPKELPWRTFHEWSKKYGPIMSVQFGGNTVIMIANAAIARELLDKRGSIYSDRPRSVQAGENMTKGLHILLRRYDEQLRLHRRIETVSLSVKASQTYFPLQDLESKQLLFDLLSSNNFEKAFDRFSGSLIYALCYGYRLHTGDEQALKDAYLILHNFEYAARVGTWIVDALPFLNLLPPALAPWKRTAEELFQIEATLHKKNITIGRATTAWNWSKEYSASKEAEKMTDLELMYNLGVLADAALDTTAVQMRIFTLAAVSYPGFIQTAQKELDDVVGPNRLPNLEDKPNLPYISAIIDESFRWRNLLPGGIPHATMQEDTYMGYRIPKGATVLGLKWAMALDENVFERPLDFIPERWLDGKLENAGQEEPFKNSFGYGRRICPGRHLARNSLFIMISRLLWGFNIKNAIDENGTQKKVDDMAFTSGFVSRPMPFEAVFEPRSAHAKALIEKEWNGAEKDVSVILNSIRDEQIALGLKIRAV